MTHGTGYGAGCPSGQAAHDDCRLGADRSEVVVGTDPLDAVTF